MFNERQGLVIRCRDGRLRRGGRSAAVAWRHHRRSTTWGTGFYLAGVAVFGLAIGALLRHTAGAITAVLGILLLLSTFWQLLMMGPEWFTTAYRYLPSVAGESIVLPHSTTPLAEGPQPLAPWTGYAIFLLYIAVTYLVAAVLLRRRDA